MWQQGCLCGNLFRGMIGDMTGDMKAHIQARLQDVRSHQRGLARRHIEHGVETRARCRDDYHIEHGVETTI